MWNSNWLGRVRGTGNGDDRPHLDHLRRGFRLPTRWRNAVEVSTRTAMREMDKFGMTRSWVR